MTSVTTKELLPLDLWPDDESLSSGFEVYKPQTEGRTVNSLKRSTRLCIFLVSASTVTAYNSSA